MESEMTSSEQGGGGAPLGCSGWGGTLTGQLWAGQAQDEGLSSMAEASVLPELTLTLISSLGEGR